MWSYKSLRIEIFFSMLIILLVFNLDVLLAAGNQEVQLIPSKSTLALSESFYVTVRYNVSDADNTLTGIGLRIYYDSTKLIFNNFCDVFGNPVGMDTSPQDDTGNTDNDSTTNKYLGIAWADFGGNWPNQTLPLDTARVNFTVISTAPPGDCTMNVSYSSKASGYGFTPTNTSVTIESEKANVTGRITTGVTGQITGIANADISLSGTSFSTITDNNGNFSFEDLPVGSYEIVVTAPYFIPVTQQIHPIGDTFQVTIPALKTYLPGDANGDGRIGLQDVIYDLQILSRQRSDFNAD